MSSEESEGVGGQNVWRAQLLTRVRQMTVLAEWIKNNDQAGPNDVPAQAKAALDEGIRKHLLAAKMAAQERPTRGRGKSAVLESALANVHAADELILRRATSPYIKGRLPDIHSDVRKYLDEHDPRRIRIETLAQHKPAPDLQLKEDDRESLVAAVTAAHSHSRQEYAQARSFRDVLSTSALILALLSIVLALLGFYSPTYLALCFNPNQKIVCPTNESPFNSQAPVPPGTDVDEVISAQARPADVLLVELVGLLAAAISGSVSLRGVSGTTTPFNLSLYLALLKLPTGALTAVLGLVLMRGGFVPGLSALDSSPQILAWAVIFGAAQQLVTGLVDQQAHSVLNNVGGKPHSEAERPAPE